MVEDKKKKYFLNVASSEKVDSFKRYNEFFIASLPYPGCEFFKIYKDHHYNGELN
jgi:myotubularin-related protein 14